MGRNRDTKDPDRYLAERSGLWSLFRIENDGARRVLYVYDWSGGQDGKPSAAGYVGATGLSANIADGVDVRGPAGPRGPGTGDMLQSVYDPGGVAGNSFNGFSVSTRSVLKALNTAVPLRPS